jgi:uncharacterized protein involved in outer membrane biogenesis
MKLIRIITRRKPLLWFGSAVGILLLVIATLAVYIGTRSDEWWRDLLTTTLSQTLGREVEIQGDFRLYLGRIITTEAASVRISNPDWSESRDMLRLGSLRLEFDLLSVLGDTLMIHRLELADVELALEENQDGQKNWAFATDKTKPPATRKRKEGITLPVHIEHLSLQRTQLSMSQPRWERPLVLVVEKITGGQSQDDTAVIEGSGRLGHLPFSLNGSLGKISSALNRGPVSYQLSGKLGEARLQSEGSIDSLAAPLRPRVDLILNGPDIAQITQAMGAPKIAEGPFDAHINIIPEGRGISSRIESKFGMLQVHAAIVADSLDSTENLGVTARLSGENLAAFADLLRLPPLPKGSFEIDTVLQNDNSITRIEKMIASVGKHRISIGGAVSAWPELKDTRLELHAEGPNLAAFTPTVSLIGLGQLPAGAYTVNALLEPGENGLQVRPSKVTAGDYQATVEGRILTTNQFQAELNVTGSGPDLSMITRLVNTIQLPAWPFQARGKIVITAKDITLIGASGTAGKHQVDVAGPIAFSSSGPLRLDVKGSGPSLQAVLQGLGYDVIPASAVYQVDGTVEITNNRLVVTAKHARLGPAEASTTLSIPDLNIPTTLMVDVRELKTTDTATALALVGMQLDLLQVMPANLSGKITRTKNTTRLSNIRGTIGATSINVDGAIGDPPDYGNTRVNLDISGPDLEHFLDHPVEQAIPFHIKGSVARDTSDTRFENLQLKVANLEANMHGRLGSWENLEGSELNISAQGPNLDAIAAILNRPLPAGAVKFDGHVRGTEDAFHIDRMNAELGRNNLSGDLKLTRGKPPRLKGKVSSTYLDLALFQKKVEPEQSSNAKTSDTVNAGAKEDEEDAPKQPVRLLFPDTPIDLEAFNQLGLDLEIQIDELANMMKLGSLYDLKVAVLLKAGKLSMKDFEVRGVRDGKVEGNMVIGYDAEITRIDVGMTGKQIRMGLAAAPGQKPETFPPADVEAKFTAAGSTYRKLANSLNGRIKVVQGEGLVSNSRAGILLSDVFYELFQSLNPFAKTEPTTRLNCGVYIANLAGGKAELQTIVIQTDKLTILSAGTVDLNTERIDIDFETRPRKGVGISASTITNAYIKLGGSLSKPAVGLNPERAAVATGAAVATAGLSFLYKGIWDRYFSSRDPCGDALKRDAELQANKAKQQ